MDEFNIEDALSQLNESSGDKIRKVNDDFDILATETERVRSILEKTPITLDDLDAKFEKETSLTGTDISFLFFAVALQVARQYLISNEKFRLTSKQGDQMVEDALSLAPPRWQDVLLQSVPYDAIKTGEHAGNTGLAGTTHRFRTLGHDPMLGWIFGTFNIMTNSLTKTDLESYQVKNMTIIRHYPGEVVGVFDRAIKYAQDDPTLLGVSVARQAIHFISDGFTIQGLPVPVIATLDNELVQQMLSKWHIDAFSVARSAGLAIIINQLISIIHTLFYDGSTDEQFKLYNVRTRKIISYSNAIASGSNLIYVGCTNDFTKLDVGGLGVTLYTFFTNAQFIKRLKQEFIFGNYKEMLAGDPDSDYNQRFR